MTSFLTHTNYTHITPTLQSTLPPLHFASDKLESFCISITGFFAVATAPYTSSSAFSFASSPFDDNFNSPHLQHTWPFRHANFRLSHFLGQRSASAHTPPWSAHPGGGVCVGAAFRSSGDEHKQQVSLSLHLLPPSLDCLHLGGQMLGSPQKPAI